MDLSQISTCTMDQVIDFHKFKLIVEELVVFDFNREG